jgi:hypothetical protein
MPTLLLKRSARIRNALVTLLAGLPSAMAAVVYFDPADVTFDRSDWVYVNVLAGTFEYRGAPSSGDFQIAYTGSQTVEVNRQPSIVDAVAIHNGTDDSLSRFSPTDTIGPAGGLAGWTAAITTYFDLTGSSGFPWDTEADGTTGRMGFRMTSNGVTSGTYYGWLGLTYDDATGSVTLHDLAYESTANRAINPVAVPEAGTAAAVGSLVLLSGVISLRAFWRS